MCILFVSPHKWYDVMVPFVTEVKGIFTVRELDISTGQEPSVPVSRPVPTDRYEMRLHLISVGVTGTK